MTWLVYCTASCQLPSWISILGIYYIYILWFFHHRTQGGNRVLENLPSMNSLNSDMQSLATWMFLCALTQCWEEGALFHVSSDHILGHLRINWGCVQRWKEITNPNGMIPFHLCHSAYKRTFTLGIWCSDAVETHASLTQTYFLSDLTLVVMHEWFYPNSSAVFHYENDFQNVFKIVCVVCFLLNCMLLWDGKGPEKVGRRWWWWWYKQNSKLNRKGRHSERFVFISTALFGPEVTGKGERSCIPFEKGNSKNMNRNNYTPLGTK